MDAGVRLPSLQNLPWCKLTLHSNSLVARSAIPTSRSDLNLELCVCLPSTDLQMECETN
jgi:hypothetical protein